MQSTGLCNINIYLLTTGRMNTHFFLKLLKESCPGSTAVSFNDAAAISDALKKKDCNFLFIDIAAGSQACLELINYAHWKYPALKIILLIPVSDAAVVKKYFESGIDACISNNISATEFKNTLNRLLANEKYIDSAISSKIINNFSRLKRTGLTQRELQLLKLIAAENRTEKIAEMVNRQKSTILANSKKIMQKLGLHSLQELKQYAGENNIC